MKRILVMLAAVAVPAALLADGGTFAKGSPEFSAIESLAAAGVITVNAGAGSFTRQEAVELAAKAVDRLLSPDSEPKPESLETAYMLLTEFETDLMEKGMGLSEIQRKMVDLKVTKERIKLQAVKDRQDLLFGMIGVRINGDCAGFMTDLVLYGNSMGAAKRYTPMTQYIDMKFTATSGTQLKAEAVFRLENLFGGNWGQQDIYGVRRFGITGDFPVSFALGDFRAGLTPFTLWANDDAREAEAKIFSDRRDMIKKEVNLEGNSWPLTGAKLGYKSDASFPAALQVQAIAARLESSGKTNYWVSPGLTTFTAATSVFNHDQYLFAGRVESDCALKDVLKAGINFADIRDIKDTGNVTAPALDNYVASLDAELKLFGIKASGEFAFSNYCVTNASSPLSWQNAYIGDTALRTGLEGEYMKTKAEAEFFVVGNSFNAYSSQSRVFDGANNYLYITQNNTWNVSQQVPAYVLIGRAYPFTKYNNVLLAGYNAIGYTTMPHNVFENNASPEGDSTPNRQGIRLKLSGKYLDDTLVPYVKFLKSSEIVSYLPGMQAVCPREFTVFEAGTGLKIMGFDLKAGYKYELTDNTYTGGSVNFSSNIVDAGASRMFLDRINLHAGFKGIFAAGSEFPYAWGYSALMNYDLRMLSYGIGADLEIIKQARASVSFTNTLITDNLDNGRSFGAQELDARVYLNF